MNVTASDVKTDVTVVNITNVNDSIMCQSSMTSYMED